MNVESVCTEAELATYLAGQLSGQMRILPAGWTDATQARTQALDDVLRALERRTPPIREADLAQPTELRRAVQYGAEMWLFYHSLTGAAEGSLLPFRYSEAKKRFQSEVDGMMPTLSGGARGSTFSFGVSRR